MADEKNDRFEALLEEIVRWLRVLAGPTVRSWLEPVLTTTEERRVYQASTGLARGEVARSAGVSHQTVSNYWNRWKSANPPIIKETERRGRYARLYDLAELNMSLEVTS
jgi:hypothetical protein